MVRAKRRASEGERSATAPKGVGMPTPFGTSIIAQLATHKGEGVSE
jgi:hypothetical protein